MLYGCAQSRVVRYYVRKTTSLVAVYSEIIRLLPDVASLQVELLQVEACDYRRSKEAA